MKVFVLDGTCFKLAQPEEVQKVYDAGDMEEEAWTKYQEGRKSHMIKHLTLARDFKQNWCKKCGRKYFVAAE